MHIFSYFSIAFSTFSSSLLKCFNWDDGGLYISPIMTFRFVFKTDLSISMNRDSNMFFDSDSFFLIVYCIVFKI